MIDLTEGTFTLLYNITNNIYPGPHDLVRQGTSPVCAWRVFCTVVFYVTVSELQRLFMTDACHLNFGKYTLFCCYGVTDNANMFPVAFGILFGNENGASWGEFWEFVKKLHPSMDMGDVTIITDQDKGQMNAIADWMPKAGHFHCSHHRRGNIIKNRGGRGGKIKYSALWM